eukprot:sb/3471659/
MSTAGAVPEVNDKGEVTMKKVKVQRYVTGKRPDYAQESSDEDEDEPVFQNEGTAPPQALRLRGPGEGEEGEDGGSEGDAEDEEEEGMEVKNEPVKLDGVKDRRLDRMRQRQLERSKDRLGERIRDREITKPEIIEDSDSESDHDTETSRRIEEARAAAAGGSESEEDDLEEDEVRERAVR